jgi:endonuclease YncB( thermonuclease family)
VSLRGLARLIKKASLVGAFLLPAFFLGQARAECPVPATLPLVQVARAVDGDTLRLVDGRSVRLIGINTPELGRKGRMDEPGAKAARDRLQALVKASAGKVMIQPGAEPYDRHGRTLAHVYTPQGRNIEATLLGEGLGFQVVVPPNDALKECHAAAERAARKAGLGLWRRFTPQPVAGLKRAGFAIVTGRVDGISRNRGGIWIDLEGSLVLQVARANERAFEDILHRLPVGQTIEARGWIVDRRRRSVEGPGQAPWLLRLTSPVMLEMSPSAAKVVGSKP